jgi:hypothetical protein
MPVFKNAEDLNRVMLALWEGIKADKSMSDQLLRSKLTVSFIYHEPDSKLTLDCSDGKELKVYIGETDFKPLVEMAMKSDLAHEFWLGKVNIPLALISGKISSRGPVNSALALLPVIKPAFKIYPAIYQHNIVEENG